MQNLPPINSKVVLIGTKEPIMEVVKYEIYPASPYPQSDKIFCSWEDFEGTIQTAWFEPSSLEIIL